MKRVLLLVLIPAAASLVSVSARGILTPTTVAIFGGGGDCVICHEDCVEGWHMAAEEGTFSLPAEWTRNGGVHQDGLCREYTCPVRHGPKCIANFAAADFTRLLQSVDQRDAPVLKKYLQEFPENISVNHARLAIQVSGCLGAMIAHLPLPEEFVASVSE